MPSLKDAIINSVKKLPEAASLDDIVDAIKEQRQEIEKSAENGVDGDKFGMTRLSERSLKEFLDAELDLYSDADLQVKQH
ncbi:MAG: hypothetical protein JW839_05500 [Candidatus Lokiarchaeota archaeon]|nr:hypothetical protein [Candidatus Lokiarchaeota archaeon]